MGGISPSGIVEGIGPGAPRLDSDDRETGNPLEDLDVVRYQRSREMKRCGRNPRIRPGEGPSTTRAALVHSRPRLAERPVWRRLVKSLQELPKIAGALRAPTGLCCAPPHFSENHERSDHSVTGEQFFAPRPEGRMPVVNEGQDVRVSDCGRKNDTLEVHSPSSQCLLIASQRLFASSM
jgi:hypothetical protein